MDQLVSSYLTVSKMRVFSGRL